MALNYIAQVKENGIIVRENIIPTTDYNRAIIYAKNYIEFAMLQHVVYMKEKNCKPIYSKSNYQVDIINRSTGELSVII